MRADVAAGSRVFGINLTQLGEGVPWLAPQAESFTWHPTSRFSGSLGLPEERRRRTWHSGSASAMVGVERWNELVYVEFRTYQCGLSYVWMFIEGAIL